MSKVKRLALVTTHPIQYNAPLFRLLTQQPGIQLKVFYTWSQSREKIYDPGFGKIIQWDIPLLEGYEYEFVENIALKPGTHHFTGIDNPALIDIIKAWQPDIILIFGWSFKSHLACMRYFKGKIPVLFRGDSTLLDEHPGAKRILRRLFLKWVYKHIDHALYTGVNNRNYFLAHGLKKNQLHFAPHAIDNDRFAEPDHIYEEEARAWRLQLGIQEQEQVILFAGKLEFKKRPDFLLQLSQKINHDSVKFLLVGNGLMETELKERTLANDRFIFMDFQNQQKMPVVYRLGDIFILPSGGPGETWGLAVNEAMACNRPIFVSDMAGSAPDLVQPEINGFIFSPGNPSQCAAMLAPLLNDREKLTGMGRSSGKLIRNYSFQKIIDTIRKLVKVL